MARLLEIVRSFWFCLAMAVWSLFSMAGELVEGKDPWLSVAVVILWVFFAWRSTQRNENESKDEGSDDGQD